MVDFPTKDAFFPAGQANAGPVRSGQRNMYDAVRQLPGARAIAALTIAAGAVTATQYRHTIDTEAAAAASDLTNILQDNLPDGALLMISSADAGRVPTVKHGAGGVGQILLADGTDLALSSPTIRLLLCRQGTTWVEEDRFYGSAKAAMRTWLELGDAATKTVGTAAGNLVALETGGKLPAVDGSQLTNVSDAGQASDIRLLFLKAAENDGDRLNMVAGIADPYADESDIDTGASSGQIYDAAGDYYYNQNIFDTSYAYADGTGDRTGSITVSTGGISWQGTASKAVDGNTGVNALLAASTGAVAGGYIQFDFGSGAAKYFTEIKESYQNATANSDTWKWQGSNDALSWSDMTATEAWGGGTTQNRTVTANYGPWRYVRKFGVAGSQNLATWLYEVDFKIGTSAPTVSDLTLVSASFIAASAPDTARIHVQVTEVDSITINTDLPAYASRDGGATWTAATLALVETLADGTKAYEDANMDISGQPSGTSMKYKIVTANNKKVRIHGTVLQWA